MSISKGQKKIAKKRKQEASLYKKFEKDVRITEKSGKIITVFIVLLVYICVMIQATIQRLAKPNRAPYSCAALFVTDPGVRHATSRTKHSSSFQSTRLTSKFSSSAFDSSDLSSIGRDFFLSKLCIGGAALARADAVEGSTHIVLLGRMRL